MIISLNIDWWCNTTIDTRCSN